MPFPTPQNIIKLALWVITLFLTLGIVFVIGAQLTAINYRPSRIVERFVTLIDNPTQTVTEAEKEELQLLTQSGFFNSWGYENNMRTLRKVKQENPISISTIDYTSERRQYATATLGFDNDFSNESSKSAKVYLERTGSWYQGYRWRIYQIDMPRTDNPLDGVQEDAQNLGERIREGAEDLQDRVKDILE